MKYVLLSLFNSSPSRATADLSNNNAPSSANAEKARRRLQTAVDLCIDLLSLLDRVDPGSSRNRGWVLKQLISPWTKLSASLLDAGLINQEEFHLRKERGLQYAKELVIEVQTSVMTSQQNESIKSIQVQCFTSFDERSGKKRRTTTAT